MTFYRRQLAIGNLELLCHHCNGIKSDVPWDVWLRAVLQHPTAPIQARPPQSPGRGTALTPSEKRDFLKAFIASYYEYGP